MNNSWKEKAKVKREKLLEAIPKEWRLSNVPSVAEEPNASKYVDSLLSEEENEITNSPLLQLKEKISRGYLSSYEVTRAFCHRTALVQQLTNCCSEIFFERALSRATQLDQYFSKHGSPSGLLHGIPISFKDQVNLEGIDSAIGYVGRLGDPITKDQVSNIAKILEDAGAVFYVKTTTPMAMMSGETVSNIYGFTLNSINRKLSCGGSSGGEGALLAAKGSLLGFGTDIGGSIRLPCNSQGLFGLRGSSNRLPYCKVTNSMANQPIMCSVIGPMSRDIEDLEFATKLIIDSQPWLNDPKCPPISWRTYDMNKKLSFGLYDPSYYTYLHPQVQRALEIVRKSLTERGHEVIDWKPPMNFKQVQSLAGDIFLADGGQEIVNECRKSGEPVRKEISMIKDGKASDQISVSLHWEQARLKYEYQQLFDQHWLNTKLKTSTGKPIDGLILPLQTLSSFRPGDLEKVKVNFTTAFNVLDYPVVATPITRADQKIDKIEKLYVPKNEDDRILYEYYDPKLYDGTPVGLQVVAPRFEEERAIGMSKVVYQCLKRNTGV